METGSLSSWLKVLLINSFFPLAFPPVGYCCFDAWPAVVNIPFTLFPLVLNRGSFYKGSLLFPSLDHPWFFMKPNSFLNQERLELRYLATSASYLGPRNIFSVSENTVALSFSIDSAIFLSPTKDIRTLKRIIYRHEFIACPKSKMTW